MTRKSKFDLSKQSKLKKLLASDVSIAECARVLGVSRRTIYDYKEELRTTTNIKRKPIADIPKIKPETKKAINPEVLDLTPRSDEPAGEVMEGCLNLSDQLQKINRYINEEMDKVKKLLDRPLHPGTPMEEVIKINVGKGKLRTQLSSLAAEVKDQLRLQLSVAETWHDVKQFYEFQQEVLGVIEQLQPGMRAEIVRKLKERRMIKKQITGGG